jgi:hypothetical protein
MVALLVSLREWYLSTHRDVTRRVNCLPYNKFDEFRHGLASLGRRLNLGISGRRSTADA